MFNSKQPDPSELPSTKQLLRSTGIAAAVAGVLVVTVVMPAEYGIDPTRVGQLLGLSEMGWVKRGIAAEIAAEEAAATAAGSAAPAGASDPESTPETAEPASAEDASAVQPDEDVFTITLAPDAGYEVKLVMEEGATARFGWATNGPGVNYDTHGDGEGIRYHGYEKGTNVDRQEGELTAAFTGSHGWFWRNRSGQPVTITLRTSGAYSDVKQYD